MKFFLNLTVIVFIAVYPTSVNAEEKELETSDSYKQETEQVFEGAKTFSECAGQFDALSWFAEKSGFKESATSFKNTYRGWQISGAYLLFSTGVVNDWQKALEHTESISAATSQSYKAKTEVDLENTQNELTQNFEEKCKPFVNYQESLVADMRKKMAQLPIEKE